MEKKILKILQENYEIENAQDLSSAIKDLFRDSLQEMMNAEFETSMGDQKHDNKTEKTNYRNGKTKKKLKSEFGECGFEIPRDRNNELEPIIVPKNKRDVSGIEVSSTMVINIKDQILPKIKKCQDRPLEGIHPICFVDVGHFSVRDDSSVVKKAAYIVLGINDYGEKDVLGIWIGENESTKF